MFPLFALAAGAFGAKAIVAGASAALGPGNVAAVTALQLNRAVDLWTAASAADAIGVPVSETLLRLLNAPMFRDFFKSDVGRSLARMLSTASYVALVPLCGPQLASATFALPGLLRGERALDAYWGETMYRIRETASSLIKSDTLNDLLAKVEQGGFDVLGSAQNAADLEQAKTIYRNAAVGVNLATVAARLYTHLHMDEFKAAIRTPEWYNQQAANATEASSTLLAEHVKPIEPLPGFLPLMRLAQISGQSAPVTASQMAWAFCSELGDDSDLLTIAFDPATGLAIDEGTNAVSY